MRLAAAVAAVALALVLPTLTAAQVTDHQSVCVTGDGDWISKVCFGQSYDPARYGHSVLGDTPEWIAMTIFNGPDANLVADGNRGATTVINSPDHIFEDIAPRLADIDGDGRLEIIVVQSAFDKGARLVAYAVTPEPRLLAATPFIGQRHRWLAPAGTADFDGDGRVEIAYVDRPHLVRDLVFLRLEGTALREIARVPGLTNHRIGDDTIAGGLRACPDGNHVILANADWARALAVGLHDATVQMTDLGPISGPADLAAYMACPD